MTREKIETMSSNDDIGVTETSKLWGVQGRPCPICFKDFENGDEVMTVSCGGGHVLCKGCHSTCQAHGILRQRNGDRQTIFEMVRRAEGADQCPVCCQMLHASVEAKTQNHCHGSGARSDAIVVD